MMHGATVVRGYRTQSIAIRGVYPVYGRIRNVTLARAAGSVRRTRRRSSEWR